MPSDEPMLIDGVGASLSSLECRLEPPALVASRTDGGAAPQLGLLAARNCYVGVAALGVPPPVEISAQRMALDDSADALGPLQLLARTA
jgi:hypothetical protein